MGCGVGALRKRKYQAVESNVASSQISSINEEGDSARPTPPRGAPPSITLPSGAPPPMKSIEGEEKVHAERELIRPPTLLEPLKRALVLGKPQSVKAQKFEDGSQVDEIEDACSPKSAPRRRSSGGANRNASRLRQSATAPSLEESSGRQVGLPDYLDETAFRRQSSDETAVHVHPPLRSSIGGHNGSSKPAPPRGPPLRLNTAPSSLDDSREERPFRADVPQRRSIQTSFRGGAPLDRQLSPPSPSASSSCTSPHLAPPAPSEIDDDEIEILTPTPKGKAKRDSKRVRASQADLKQVVKNRESLRKSIRDELSSSVNHEQFKTSELVRPKLKRGGSNISMEEAFPEMMQEVHQQNEVKGDVDKVANCRMQDVYDQLAQSVNQDLEKRRALFRSLCLQFHASPHDSMKTQSLAETMNKFLMDHRDWYLTAACPKLPPTSPKLSRERRLSQQ